MSCKVFPKSASSWVVVLAVVVATTTCVVTLYKFSRFWFAAESPAPELLKTTSAVTAVTSLGRLQPQEEVVRLFAPSSLEGVRVAQLLVKQGDRVQPGQVIAIVDSRDYRQAALEQTQKQVRVAQARLAQVRAGARPGEIAAQNATIARLEAELQWEIAAQNATVARLEAELRFAQTDYQRYQQLYQEGAITASNLDSIRLKLQTTKAQLNEVTATRQRIGESIREQINEAKATLNRIAEIRPVDVKAAQTEVDSAIAAVKRAKADLDLAYIRAPLAGQILKIHARPGEAVSEQGIVELGQTQQMEASAEVYQTDIGKVQLGQRATITSEAFPEKLQGTVSQIGLKVSKQDIFSTESGAAMDRRVIEVKIRLDSADSQRVADLTDLQVQVAIHLNRGRSQPTPTALPIND